MPDFYILNNNAEFKFENPFDRETAIEIMSLILNSELLKKSKMKFTLDTSSLINYELTRIFL